MGNIFDVCIARKDSTVGALSAELSLPASPYQVLDALEKIRTARSDEIHVQIEDCHGFDYLAPMIAPGCGFYELNALAEKLSTLDATQRTAYQGLARMEMDRSGGPLPASLLMDIAHSMDICHVVAARNDAELGRFYADNGFVPEVGLVPDEIYDLLDFEQIGRRMRRDEGGVFMDGCYVVRDDELAHASTPLPDGPPQPEYIFRLTAAEKYPEDFEARRISLDLPASKSELDAVPQKLGVDSWADVAITGYDGAIPDLPTEWYGVIGQLNELAKVVEDVRASGNLARYKAILAATECREIDEMRELANSMDDFIYSPSLRSPEDLALSELKIAMADTMVEQLLPYLNLRGFGEAMATSQNMVFTGYGAVERQDGRPIQNISQESGSQGMEVMM